jgi:hypothetical protein
LVEATEGTYNIQNDFKIGETLKFIRSKNTEGLQAVVSPEYGYPNGNIYIQCFVMAQHVLYILEDIGMKI